MKKVLAMVAFVMVSVIVYAFNDGSKINADQQGKEVKSGEVIVMNKDMFIKDVFDYENTKEWKYKGNKPAIIDLYADWCGPCRMTAPIMKSLAKEYDGKIVIYKVNVDKEKELAALFNATSIPLFVFIPMNGEPQLFRGVADKATYQKAIDEFLLKQ
ncbi:thioredoxin family protein [Bacteroides nordii]|jgi:thioredoxin 1|uniref:thioredoxin family protein n=1 Tax=Bacteroides nordii TaxID=291645 RepID=UPI00189867A8|nr:thioredoxin domain-containing protein [Bacteroides nordii]